MDVPDKNVVNAGIIFMCGIWLQGQMSDLIILKKAPHLIPDFVNDPKKVPKAFHIERVKYWEKQFSTVKSEFIKVFANQLTLQEKQDLDEIYQIRNMIAHAHVSFGRDYMLFRPHGGPKKEQELVNTFKLNPIKDQSDPVILKLEFWKEDVFQRISDLIERLDQVCLRKIADTLGVPHGRIR